MSDDGFKHISVGLNQMLVKLRRRMDENKTEQPKSKNIPQPSDDESENAA